MTKTVLHPPRDATYFAFGDHGCGRGHEYDGKTGIDCAPCVAHVARMSVEERVQDPALRTPLMATGDTPAEVAAQHQVHEARRQAASFRLEEADDAPEPSEPRSSDGADDLAAENERLRARLAELEAQQPPQRAQRSASRR